MPAPPSGVAWLLVVVLFHGTAILIAKTACGYDGASEGEWTRADVEEHVRDEYSTFSWVMEAMIERCGSIWLTLSTPRMGSSPGTCPAR